MELDHSPYLDKISDEAMKAADEFIDASEDISRLVSDAASVADVAARREEILQRSEEFFQSRGIKIREGQKALTSALISRWSRLHPLNKSTE